MEIVVTGRNTEIPARFREHVEEKVSKVETLSNRVQRVDVEVTFEPNPRQADKAERIELTVRGKGPVIRAEASASDRYGALDLATAKLLERLRRHHDRSRDHHRRGEKLPPELLTPADLPPLPGEAGDTADAGDGDAGAQEPAPLVDDAKHLEVPTEKDTILEQQIGDSPVIVRQKLNDATPMTADQALYQMEMLGHDFFQFVDDATGQPCVVYKRRGWTYGLLRLDAKVEGWAGATDGQAAIDAVS